MPEKVLVLIGTKKGAFIAESDGKRGSWKLRGPFCEHWPMNHVVGDAATGAIYGAGGNEWFGPAVWKSTDLGETWTHSSDGLAYEAGEEPIKAVWSLARRNGSLYAGVQPAGLFRSDDGGATWNHIEGLQRHPSRKDWNPGGAGLILHSIVTHPRDEEQIWVGISSAGVFYTWDGGKTWEPRNKGLRRDWPADYEDIGFCVHKVTPASDFERMYQQNHVGMHRSDDAGKTWTEITEGLPTEFGFAAATHPHDRDTFYVIPLDPGHGRTMPDGHAAVWRTRDAGSSWQQLDKGLPQENAYVGVLREGMAIDAHDEPGLYFGTSTGQLYASTDEGDSWDQIGGLFPGITSVTVAEVA